MTDAVWLLVTGLALFSLLWVLSLVPLAISLAHEPRRPKGPPAPLERVRAALLALNAPERPWRFAPLSDAVVRLDWDVVDASWAARFRRVRLSAVYRAWFYLHEPAHEVRSYESLRSTVGFIGFQGWRLVIWWRWSYAGGWLRHAGWSGHAYGIARGFPPRIAEVRSFSFDTGDATRAVEAAANGAGWVFRPVPLPHEVTPWGVRLGEALTPRFTREWSQRRFWGAAHVAAWFGIAGTALAFVPWTAHNLGGLALVLGSILAVEAAIIGLGRLMERRSGRGEPRRRAA